MKYDYELINKYEKLEELRKQLRENEKSLNYYEYLKELNINDTMYGWMFINNDILEDTLEDLDLYQKPYIMSVLQVYINELESILLKVDL